jgi:hypothetical protein
MTPLPLVEISYFALFLLSIACIAAGVVGALIHTWSLRAVTYSLDSRLSVVEGNLLREVKARAGQERWKKPDKDAALASELITPTKPRLNFWQTNLPRAVER